MDIKEKKSKNSSPPRDATKLQVSIFCTLYLFTKNFLKRNFHC